MKLSEIKFSNRARSDYGDLDKLGISLTKYGMFHPIVLDSDNNLIAGGRRYSAAAMLGWEDVPVKYLKDLTPHEIEEVELEENIQRKNLTWQEEVKLKEKLHLVKEKLNPDWSVEKTAEELKESPANTSRDLSLARDLQRFPELKNEPDKKIARTKARRLKEVELRKMTSNDNASEKISNLFLANEKLSLMKGDCRDHIQAIPDNSIDLILCDPPFGIDFPKKLRNSAYNTTYGEFEDTINNVSDLLVDLVPELYRVMKPGSHMYMFFGIQHYQRIIDAIKLSFYNNNKPQYHEFPLLWIKKSNQNMLPYHRFTMNYESFLFIWKPGEFHELTKPHMATFEYDIDRKDANRCHPAQKPVGLYEDLIRTSSHEGETILDPFMGSGISIASAIKLNRKAIGIEYEDDWFELAKWNIARVNEDDVTS